jgi:hypothetical protein
MSQLNSIIASILSDINEAKSQADAASRDIAKSYAADQILRYFPVPRIGIQNLEVEIKYAVQGVEEKPMSNAQSQKKIADFISAFSREAAKEIKTSIEKVTQTNELYKGLGKSYPPDEWENELRETIINVLEKSVQGNDVSKTSQIAKEGMKKSLPELLPVVKKSSSLAIVPTETGEYQIIGLDKLGKSEFQVVEKYESEGEALIDAKSLSSSLKANKIKVEDVKNDSANKLETANLKAGNKSFQVSVDTKKVGTGDSKSFLEKSVVEKGVQLNKVVVAKPRWLGGTAGTINSGGANKPMDDFEDDMTLSLLAEKVIVGKLPIFETGISKILSENKTTVMNVTVDSEAINKAKPETISTIKFTLGSQDFTIMEDEDHNPTL